MVIITSCSPKITHKEDYLLAKQSFKGNKAITAEFIEPLLPQKPNKTILGAPVALWIYRAKTPKFEQLKPIWSAQIDSLDKEFEKLNLYYKDQPKKIEKIRNNYNKKVQKLTNCIENGTWSMRTFGEKPSYFLESDAKKNAQRLKTYYINQGYRNAQVNFQIDSLKNTKRVKVLYTIEEGIPFKLNNIDILTHTDPDIDSLIIKTKAQSFLKSGDNFKIENVVNEQARIEKLMRNNGYYTFNKQYLRPSIDAKGKIYGGYLIDTSIHIPETDTLFRSYDIKGLQVNYPFKQKSFPKYKVGEVRFSVDGGNSTKHDTAFYQGINYAFTQRYYSPKVLNTRILVRPNEIYKQENVDETNIQLSSLDQFKYYRVDTDTLAGDGKIRTLIRVLPLDKYQYNIEVGGSVVQSYPGPFLNATFKVRNVFNRMENFEFSLRGARDWQTSFNSNDGGFYKTTEYGVNSSLIFPKILLPSIWLTKLRKKNPRTIVSLGYNYIDRQPDFTRYGLRTSMTYTWAKNQQESFIVSPVDLSILRTDKTPEFEDRLIELFNQNGNPLIYSYLDRAFVSSISAAYIFNNHFPSQNLRSKYMRFFIESGGTTINLIGDKKFTELFNYEPYKFIKLNTEYRSYWPVGKKSQMVFRFNGGAILNYDANKVAPYEKNFTAGGSNSMRAWPPRRLGLGSAFPKLSEVDNGPVFVDYIDGKPKDVSLSDNPTRTQYGRFNYQFEQLGDVLLESNLELRGHLFRFIGDVNYALFIDAGNVWSLRPNEPQENSTFAFNRFYKEIAVGTGVGVRYDFSFFIIRLDLGIKVYDPARKFYLPGDSQVIDQRYLLPYFSFNRDSPNYPVYNIGIGYPF